jgi:M6 family metalloprotease-like protein
MKMIAAAFAALLVLGASPASAVPPHPDLAREIRLGLRPEPGYLRQLREEGPPKLRGDRKAGKVIKGKKAKGREEFQFAPAPGSLPVEGSSLLSLSAPPATGTQKALVLLVEFSDIAGQAEPTDFDDLVFGSVSPSVKHYYEEVSGGSFSIVTDDLPSTTGWLTLPGTKEYYRTNLVEMARDAVAEAEAVDFDFSPYDNDSDGLVDYLIIVHVGRGGELLGESDLIWSQYVNFSPAESTDDGVGVDTFITVPEYWYYPNPLPSSDPTDMTIGVYVHEFGHLLGLPDLYDPTLTSMGIGDWGLMGLGTWNGPADRGESPAWPGAWSRVALEWTFPVIPTDDVADLLLSPVESGGPVYYLWENGAANSEFFLVENRQQLGYDAELPFHGLLIWHVDETKSGNSPPVEGHDDCDWPAHYLVALQQSDGFLNLEFYDNTGDPGDPYPGIFDYTEFSLTSTPNSGSYADCSSYVALRNISETDGNIVVDVEVKGPPKWNDVVFDFGAVHGVWAWLNYDPAGWAPVTGLDPEGMAIGDFDGNGQDDVVFDFGAVHGVWTWLNNDPAGWAPVTGLDPEGMAVGDLDGSGEDDVVFDFGVTNGVWRWLNNDPAGWSAVTGLDPEGMAVGDIDGSGEDDVVFDFGVTNGVWAWLNNDPAGWNYVTGLKPEGMAVGDLDDSGKDDVLFDYGQTYGVWAYFDNDPARWAQPTSVSTGGMACGNLDGL